MSEPVNGKFVDTVAEEMAPFTLYVILLRSIEFDQPQTHAD